MPIKFITGNLMKIEEVSAFLDQEIEQLDIDLAEIQSLDSKEIIEAKLLEAKKHESGPMFCEDTSLYLEGMNGFPGPFVKFMLKAIGAEGIYNQVKATGNNKAYAQTIIGYTDGNVVQFFEGRVHGTIVSPTKEGKGWDPIFKPDGHDKTYGQMSVEEKNSISHRIIATKKLKEHLENKN